jgi:rubrerythrin
MKYGMNWIVTTEDVDGMSKRNYDNAEAARARFEEMVGYPIENAIWEMLPEMDDYPEWTSLPFIKGVSNYGCVVSIEWERGGDVHCLKCDHVWNEQDSPDACPVCGNADKQQTVYLTIENN